jgi:hypothetical protein
VFLYLFEKLQSKRKQPLEEIREVKTVKKTSYSFFRKLHYSITRPSEYLNMAGEGAGRAILYLLLLALTLGVVNGTFQSVKAAIAYTGFLDGIKEELPDFTLENGELTVEGDEPIIFEEAAGETIIIDDTGTYTKDNIDSLLGESSNVVLITKEYVLMVDPTETNEIRFAEFGELYVDKNMVLTFLPYLTWLTVLMGVFIVIWFFVSKLVMGLFYGLIGLIASKIQKRSYSYGKAYSMGLYAITLPSVLDIVFNMFGINLPWLVYFLITLIYFFLANRTTPTASRTDEVSPDTVEIKE